MEKTQEQPTTPTKCKTYILNCSTCHERFASTKCSNPAEKHTHSKPQELSPWQGGQFRAKLEGFSTNCWHCDPEAQLDFTSRIRTRNGSTVSRTESMRKRMDSTVSMAGSIRKRVSRRQLQSRIQAKTATHRGSTTAALRMARVGRALRRWKSALSGLSVCFASRQRDWGEKIPEDEMPSRPASAHTIDAWKLPRMFTPIDY